MTKTEIQEKIINTIIENNCRGIVLSSVRSGKTRILLKTIERYFKDKNPKVLVLYPNIDIKSSWEKECDIIDYFPDITYCTFASMSKILNYFPDEKNEWDYIIVDEAHLLGEENQLPLAGKLAQNTKHIIFASGTYNRDTLSDIKFYTKLKLIVNYPTSEAIKDGIVSDFTVYVHRYYLNNSRIIQFGKVKKWNSTEKKECNRLGNRILKLSGQQKMFASLERMRFINSCNSLIEKVNKWISENKDERFILFSSDKKQDLNIIYQCLIVKVKMILY